MILYLISICYYHTDKSQSTNLKKKSLKCWKTSGPKRRLGTSIGEGCKVFPYLGIRWTPHLILFVTSITSGGAVMVYIPERGSASPIENQDNDVILTDFKLMSALIT